MVINLKRQKKWVLIPVSIILALVILICVAFNSSLKTQFYTVESEKISAPVRLALITDLHGSGYGEKESELIKTIDKQAPDAILLGGDIFDENTAWDNAEYLLEGISKYPCYYVTGNHEYVTGKIGVIYSILRSHGVKILSGNFDVFEVNGQKINICGIADPDAGLMAQQLRDLAYVHNNGNFTLLLTHRTNEIETYRNYNFDLVLAGHNHGGQWRLPGIINGFFTPDQGFFPDYAGGRYDFDDTTLIVGRGLARDYKIPRIFNRPELVIVDLK